MEILVNRFVSDDDTTLSLISVDGEFTCFGLEDEYRETKVSCETRIAAGTYPVRLRTVGGFNRRYKRKFGELHEGMLQVMHVSGFEYILIHIGNTDEDTAGCLLVGEQAVATFGEMRINSSRTAYVSFYLKVLDAAKNNNLEITYQDNDGHSLAA